MVAVFFIRERKSRRCSNPVSLCLGRLKTTSLCSPGRPKRPDAAVLVAATDDAYVSPQSVMELHAHWPGSVVRWVAGGHVTAFVLNQVEFREAILESLARLRGGEGRAMQGDSSPGHTASRLSQTPTEALQ
jgi:Alpha/beta hydrolase domain containing 18